MRFSDVYIIRTDQHNQHILRADHLDDTRSQSRNMRSECDRYWREAECGDMSHGVHCVTALSPAWWHVTSVIITQAYILNPPILYSFV